MVSMLADDIWFLIMSVLNGMAAALLWNQHGILFNFHFLPNNCDNFFSCVYIIIEFEIPRHFRYF